VFEKYWDHLGCLSEHPDYGNESEYARYCMTLFSRGLSGMAAQGKLHLLDQAAAGYWLHRVSPGWAIGHVAELQPSTSQVL
jgi:hypothetical protein